MAICPSPPFQCESKLLLLMEEAMPPAGSPGGLDDLLTANIELPANNRRIKLPTSDDEHDDVCASPTWHNTLWCHWDRIPPKSCIVCVSAAFRETSFP